MTATHFQTTNQALLHMAAEAFASAPHLTPAQKQTRTEATINTIMAFLPTEPVQTMLASQCAGHHFTLLETFRDIASRTPPDAMSVRLRAVAGQQTKAVLALLKEIRVVRAEMRAATEAEQAAKAQAAPPPPAPEPPADVEKPANRVSPLPPHRPAPVRRGGPLAQVSAAAMAAASRPIVSCAAAPG